MAKYPIYLNMESRRAVIIGAGAVALRKAQALLETGARVTVVAENIKDSLRPAFEQSNLELILSRYSKEYIVESTIVIASTDDPTLNQRIYSDCQELEILCNVVDCPELCDFYVPAVVRRGDLQIAIGTDGNCPAYAGHIRRKLEEVFTETHGQFVNELEKVRKRIIQDIPDANQRKCLLGQLASDESFEFFTDNGTDQWHKRAEEIIINNSNTE